MLPWPLSLLTRNSSVENGMEPLLFEGAETIPFARCILAVAVFINEVCEYTQYRGWNI